MDSSLKTPDPGFVVAIKNSIEYHYLDVKSPLVSILLKYSLHFDVIYQKYLTSNAKLA